MKLLVSEWYLKMFKRPRIIGNLTIVSYLSPPCCGPTLVSFCPLLSSRQELQRRPAGNKGIGFQLTTADGWNVFSVCDSAERNRTFSFLIWVVSYIYFRIFFVFFLRTKIDFIFNKYLYRWSFVYSLLFLIFILYIVIEHNRLFENVSNFWFIKLKHWSEGRD